ncbi:hypothetical protein F5Y16DRAFT_102001 [Xylariaceae sp. FL0255]|nr:hypothetical protein F5Y16DRAFT_102001 [Xylariaceae sp. FL0255]
MVIQPCCYFSTVILILFVHTLIHPALSNTRLSPRRQGVYDCSCISPWKCNFVTIIPPASRAACFDLLLGFPNPRLHTSFTFSFLVYSVRHPLACDRAIESCRALRRRMWTNENY